MPGEPLCEYGCAFDPDTLSDKHVWNQHVHIGNYGQLHNFGVEVPDHEVTDSTTLHRLRAENVSLITLTTFLSWKEGCAKLVKAERLLQLRNNLGEGPITRTSHPAHDRQKNMEKMITDAAKEEKEASKIMNEVTARKVKPQERAQTCLKRGKETGMTMDPIEARQIITAWPCTWSTNGCMNIGSTPSLLPIGSKYKQESHFGLIKVMRFAPPDVSRESKSYPAMSTLIPA